MAVQGADVLVVGAGAVGRSIAFALASAEPTLRVWYRPVVAAVLGALGEVTHHGARTRHGRLRSQLAVTAAARWPAWREQVHARAGIDAPPEDGYGTGTFVTLNAVSSRLDDASFTEIARTAAAHGLECQDTDPSDIPGSLPLDNDRAVRAWYLPQEGFIDARAWLATLDAALTALPNLIRTTAGTLTALPARGYLLDTPVGGFRARRPWWPPGRGPPGSSTPWTHTCPSYRSWPQPVHRRQRTTLPDPCTSPHRRSAAVPSGHRPQPPRPPTGHIR
ncbi:hypothetical protein [Streptomyces griseus]